jgi:hypothetical protein
MEASGYNKEKAMMEFGASWDNRQEVSQSSQADDHVT